MRLIDADKITYMWQEYKEGKFTDGVTLQSVIQRMPTVEAALIKHGHWELLDECSNAGVYCSICNKKVYKEHYANVKPMSKFCPNCGAIMDGEFKKL